MEPATAHDGSDPTPAALPWVAIQGRAPLAERIHYSNIGEHKDG